MAAMKLSQNETRCQGWSKDWITQSDWCTNCRQKQPHCRELFLLIRLCLHTWLVPPASLQELKALKMHIFLLSKSRLSRLAMTSLSVWPLGWGICPGLVTVGPGASWRLGDSSCTQTQQPVYGSSFFNQFMGENRWVCSSETNHSFRHSFSMWPEQAIRSLSLHSLLHGPLTENNGKFDYTLWYFWFHIRKGITMVISPKTY